MFKLIKVYSASHKEIKTLAASKGLTMQDFVVELIKEYKNVKRDN